MKPTPNSDMWQQLDAAINALPNTPTRPPNSFTRKEFQEQRGGIEDGAALRLIHKLIGAGKVKKIGYLGSTVYYKFVEENK